MAIEDSEIRFWAGTPYGVAFDMKHWLFALYHAVRMSFDSTNTAHTYRYCWHLDRTTFFRTRYMAYLNANPKELERWHKPRLFVDEMPDAEDFRDYPEGTIGRCYFEMFQSNQAEGLRELRDYRLRTIPSDRDGLDLKATEGETEHYDWLAARRNIFMTSTHDYCHMLTGSTMDLVGEAVCSKYQDHHLPTPQHLLNRRLCMIAQLCMLKLGNFRNVRSWFPAIEASVNYSEVDLGSLWDRPLNEVRLEMGIPGEGIMPAGRIRPAVRVERPG